MIDFTDISEVLIEIEKAQEADKDLRDYKREAHVFLNKRNGQWEDTIYNQFKDRPRYTFDKCTPVVKQHTSEINNADYSLRVKPAGGKASKQTARVLDGLIRNIRNISNAESVFKSVSKGLVIGGMDAMEVVQDYVDGDSFDQNLFIRKIHNAVDRVWFLGMPEEQDSSDAPAVVVLSAMATKRYKEKYPEGSAMSVGEGRQHETYPQKAEHIIIGKLLYKTYETIDLVKMSDGAIYKDDEKFQQIVDELREKGIVEEDRRPRKVCTVYSRLFDGKDWLSEPEETVFSYLPVVMALGNYEVFENKRIWYGEIEKLMDSQRVYNYSASRQVEDNVLTPRDKLMVTEDQADGYETDLENMNNSTSSVQIYKWATGQTPPYYASSNKVNPGLQAIMQQTSNDIHASSGMFASNMGDNPGLQSGVAIDRQIEKGDNNSEEWLDSMEVAILYLGKVLIDAIPKAYDASRQERVLQEDGSFEMTPLNTRIFDQETRQIVEVNNLSEGVYDVVCERGIAFKSKQREAASAFTEMAKVDPDIIHMAKDVYYNNLDAPGMDKIAERARLQLLMENRIPPEQQTEEEKAMLTEMEQMPKQPDPNMVLAEAEVGKAQAMQTEADNKTLELQIQEKKIDLEAAKFAAEQENKLDVEAVKLDQKQQQIEQAGVKMVADFALKLTEMEQKYQTELNRQIQENTLVYDPDTETFKGKS